VERTATEFELLRYLMRNLRRVLSKAQILDRLWHYDFGGQSNVVELYVSYLRKKIDAGRPPMIHTVRGASYVLKPPMLSGHSDLAIGTLDDPDSRVDIVPPRPARAGRTTRSPPGCGGTSRRRRSTAGRSTTSRLRWGDENAQRRSSAEHRAQSRPGRRCSWRARS
jgi:Transcriptional regulatory protein, C terminal